jgi:hypothetical protein
MQRCPNCLKMTVDETGKCTQCGMLATTSTVIDDSQLAGLLTNVRVRMRDLGLDEFQQLLGPFSPRPGHGPQDGISFTEDTCRLTHHYLLKHNIFCIRIVIITRDDPMWSLIVGHRLDTLERCIKKLQDHAKRHRGERILIFRTLEE